eukprot:COSAG01_NODE_5325_length_4333_cov_27.694851_1_plen_214_part_00
MYCSLLWVHVGAAAAAATMMSMMMTAAVAATAVGLPPTPPKPSDRQPPHVAIVLAVRDDAHIQHSTAHTALHSMHYTQQHSTAQHSSTAQQCAVLCCAVLCCAVLCCAVLCCAHIASRPMQHHQSPRPHIIIAAAIDLPLHHPPGCCPYRRTITAGITSAFTATQRWNRSHLRWTGSPRGVSSLNDTVRGSPRSYFTTLPLLQPIRTMLEDCC